MAELGNLGLRAVSAHGEKAAAYVAGRWCASPVTAASVTTWPELKTAARYQIPVVVVVNNNGAYGADRRSEPNPYRRDDSPEADLSWSFGQHSVAQIARELGCAGVRVKRPTDISSALHNALDRGKPVVLDVLTDPTAAHPRAWTPPARASV